MSIWEELGISGGTAILVLIALYFVIKWAVKNAITEAYTEITGEDTAEDKRLLKLVYDESKEPKK